MDQSLINQYRALDDGSSNAWHVVAVVPQEEYRLQVRFNDCTEGVVDLSRLIFSNNAGVFAMLTDFRRFSEVTIEYGAVTWPGGLDLGPDAMYDEISAYGEWRL
nr:DUF2442 domain-containing protein [uncultured Halomonas sp.]